MASSPDQNPPDYPWLLILSVSAVYALAFLDRSIIKLLADPI